MNTLELINTLLDTIIPNELVREIIKDSIAIHSKSDPIVVAKTADKWSPLSDVEVAYYKPDTHSRGEVLAKNLSVSNRASYCGRRARNRKAQR